MNDNLTSVTPDTMATLLGGLGQPELGPSPLRVGLALMLVVCLLTVVLYFWRRHTDLRSTRGRGGDVKVVNRTLLGRRNAVVLLEVDGRRILVGATPTNLTALSEWETPPEPELELAETELPISSRFDTVLGRVINRLKTLEGSPT